MMSEQEIAEYRPIALKRRILVRYLFATALGASVLSTSVPPGAKVYCFIVFLAVATLFSANDCSAGYGSIPEAIEVYRFRNRIGYQLVWMLDKDNQLTNRIERRDHQNAQLNTSKYAVYQILGGAGGQRMVIAHSADGSPFKTDDNRIQLTSLGGQVIRVRSRCFGYSIGCMDIETFLSWLNSAGNHFNLVLNLRVMISALRGWEAGIHAQAGEIADKSKEIHELMTQIEHLREDRDRSRVVALWALAVIKHAVVRIEHSARMKTGQEAQSLLRYLDRHYVFCRNSAPEHIGISHLPGEFDAEQGFPSDTPAA